MLTTRAEGPEYPLGAKVDMKVFVFQTLMSSYKTTAIVNDNETMVEMLRLLEIWRTLQPGE
jgi:hypothetical protein